MDAVGSQAALDMAVDLAARGGRIVTVGATAWRGELNNAVFLKELSLLTSLMYGHHRGRREFDQAVQVLAEQPELARLLVTHRFPLDRAEDAFRAAARRDAGAIKVQLHP